MIILKRILCTACGREVDIWEQCVEESMWVYEPAAVCVLSDWWWHVSRVEWCLSFM